MNLANVLSDLAAASEICVVTSPLFSPGKVVATSRAISELMPGEILYALARHARGNWGDVDEEDRRFNDLAVRENLRIHSVYHNRNGKEFWVITECDRSVTTVLFPDED